MEQEGGETGDSETKQLEPRGKKGERDKEWEGDFKNGWDSEIDRRV